ncbi:cytochrome P450 [Mycobacterium sp. THU-M104]|uniref:cytochrome P450 n=1 Tax=Mycobacterium sp. THU-M104 TaxID=3410515 RepID=UPI003B9B645E
MGQVSDFPPTLPPFADADRTVIAADPKEYWRELQAEGVFVGMGGYYLVTRREDVLAALGDYATFSSRRQPLPLPGAGMKPLPTPVPLAYDPPAHSRFRRILQPYFTARAADELLPALREQASALIGALLPRGGCDAIADVSIPFPFGVLTALCGLPLGDRDKLAAWAQDVNWDTPGSPHASGLFAYLVETITGDERPALASQLLTGADPLTENEVIGFYALLCSAQDAIQAAIGSALLYLARDRRLRRCLRDNPDRIGAFIEELLRLETPFPFIGRFTARQVTLAGVTIPAGSVVVLCLATTNLEAGDGSSVSVTDDGKIQPKRHQSFAAGIHRCLGKALARMELTVIINEFLNAITDFELEPDFTPRFTFTPGGAVMPSSLPLRWGPAC